MDKYKKGSDRAKYYDDNDYKVKVGQINELRTDKKLIPDAPFKENWYNLAIKRILKYAADNGYKRIGMTTAKQQEDRYDLTRVIDRIESEDMTPFYLEKNKDLIGGKAVHVVPVFGESGALLEHWVFRLFYNWPITIRRRMKKIAQIRSSLKPRYWHVPVYMIAAALLLNIADLLYFEYTGIIPLFKDTWWLSVILMYISGIGVTLGCRGASLPRRILLSSMCGVFTGIFYSAGSVLFIQANQISSAEILVDCFWRVFIYTLVVTASAIITEIRIQDPDLKL